MNLKTNYLKHTLPFILFCFLLITCKQKTVNQKTVPVDLSYTFKSEKAEALSVKAFNLHKENKYEEAISLYQQAIMVEPDNPKLFFDVSECYANNKELDKALSALNAAIILDSLNPAFYNNRGLIYWKLYKDENAINDYNKAILLGSKNWITYSNLSIAYYGNKNQSEACESFKIAKNLGLTTKHVATDKHLTILEESCK